jgi:hypothetical protein
MTIPQYRSSEPLYLVIVKEAQAEQNLRAWAKKHGCQVQIDGNRMKIFDARSLVLFQTQWNGSWDSVMIWDYWSKRHVTI